MATRKPTPQDRRAKLAAARAAQARQERRRRLRTIGLIAFAVAVVGGAAIEFGQLGQLPIPPSSYKFPSGL